MSMHEGLAHLFAADVVVLLISSFRSSYQQLTCGVTAVI
jgi:hypothetical protein